MTGEDDLARVERLFQEAVELPSEERDAFLERHCEGDAPLRSRLERLLGAAEDGESLPDPGAPTAEIGEREGDMVGRYRLLERIGEGGFGVVFMAEQLEPVVRKVALKVLKQGMDTKEVVARFEAERQALALMDHPGIAKVLDAGATSAGRPYFVMELVRGVSITDYCDQHRLSTRERLDLFVEVCFAVQHAHQKGVIHRDLKPSNVLVTLHDGRPVPKVIDFGIAKALHARLTEKTLFTRFQQFVGTPAYMSPEQAEMSALDVDTRADIYSLGVLLYELLTGTTPFDTKALWQAGLAEMQRVLREVPPERPSARVSTTGDVQLAERRRLDVSTLSRSLRGDLDWIVLHALEKDRRRRYTSAGEFAEDVRRHLRHEPVLASPPSAIYRMRKFVERNRLGVLSAILILCALIVAVVGTSFGMWEASRQRDAAEREVQNTRDVVGFLISVVSLADPQFALHPDLSVRDLLDHTSGLVDESFERQPEAEARTRAAMGRAYLTLGEHRLAERHLERACALMEHCQGVDSFEHYAALWAMTNVSYKLERDDAFEWGRRARSKGHSTIRARFPELAELLEACHSTVAEHVHAADPAPLERAVGLLAEARRAAKKDLPVGDPLWEIVGQSFMACGYWTWYTAHEVHGVHFFEAALEVQERTRPTGHPESVESLSVLTGMLVRTGELDAAEERLRGAVARLESVLPADSFPRAFAESILGELLTARAEFDEAEQFLLRSHQVLIAGTSRPTDFYAVDSWGRLVHLYDAWEKPDEARRHRRSLAELLATGPFINAFAIARRAFEPEDPVADALGRLEVAAGGVQYNTLGDFLARFPAEDLDLVVARLERATTETTDFLLARHLLNYSHRLQPESEDAKRIAEVVWRVIEPWQERVPRAVLTAAARRIHVNAVHGTVVEDSFESARRLEALLDNASLERSWFAGIERVQLARAFDALGRRDLAVQQLDLALDSLDVQFDTDHPQTVAIREERRRLETGG